LKSRDQEIKRLGGNKNIRVCLHKIIALLYK